MTKFKNKYRIESVRAQWWDYGWNGAYFITICTKNRSHFFGEIAGGKMNLSRTGVITDLLWHEIPNHSKLVDLGAFVVMPNHIHGILIIDKPDGGENGNGNGNGNVDTRHALYLQSPQSPQSPPSPPPPPPTSPPTSPPSQSQSSKSQLPGKTRFQNQGKNTVSSIIGSYKSAVTRHANRLGFENGWQRLFNDHIIRNFTEYERIKNYILNNPSNWNEDRFNG